MNDVIPDVHRQGSLYDFPRALKSESYSYKFDRVLRQLVNVDSRGRGEEAKDPTLLSRDGPWKRLLRLLFPHDDTVLNPCVARKP